MALNNQKNEKLCENILQKENYYEILGLKPDCNFDQIKRAYRLLALQVHPDKNSYSQARLAFQKISKAFVCLSSSNLRELYDRTGNEDVPDSLLQQNFDDDFANKVFFEFFNEIRMKKQKNEPLYKSYLAKCFILQLLPIFIILAVCIYTNRETSKIYSFHVSNEFNVRKITSNYKISYFISVETERESNSTLLNLIENEIETQYLMKKSQTIPETQNFQSKYSEENYTKCENSKNI